MDTLINNEYEKFYSTDLETANFPPHIVLGLYRNGYNTVGQIAKMSMQDLLKIEGIDSEACLQIADRMSELRIQLNESISSKSRSYYLNQAIEEFELSRRSFNILKQAGVNYGRDLLSYDTPASIYSINNMVPKCADEIATKLNHHGICNDAWSSCIKTEPVKKDFQDDDIPINGFDDRELFPDDPLDSDIAELDLSDCTFSILKRFGVNSIGDLLFLPENSKMIYIGKQSVEEIALKLKDCGFCTETWAYYLPKNT